MKPDMELFELKKDKRRLDFLCSIHGTIWLFLNMSDKRKPLTKLTRDVIDRRLASEAFDLEDTP